MTSNQEIIGTWLEEAKATSPAASYSARRAEPRFEWHSPLELRVNGKVHYVTTRDISQAGIGINSRLELSDKTAVQIRRGPAEPWINAKVKRATQTVGGYKVGVGFDLELTG